MSWQPEVPEPELRNDMNRFIECFDASEDRAYLLQEENSQMWMKDEEEMDEDDEDLTDVELSQRSGTSARRSCGKSRSCGPSLRGGQRGGVPGAAVRGAGVAVPDAAHAAAAELPGQDRGVRGERGLETVLAVDCVSI